jgi:signal transduction histidine kinase
MSPRNASLRNRLHTIAFTFLVILATTVALLIISRYRKGSRELSFPPTRSSLLHNDAWLALGGEWTANAAEVENNSEERGAKLMSRLGNWGDYQVQADLKMASPYGMAGLIIRSSGEEEGVDSYYGYFAGVRSMDRSVEFGRADFGWRSFSSKPLPSVEDDLDWIHLRVVAVGCKFGVAATLPDGRTISESVEDRDCIRSGRFGLRSYLTSATWRNIEITSATAADLNGFQSAQLTSVSDDFLLGAPINPERLERYISSLRMEAKKHEIHPAVEPISNFPLSPGTHSNVTVQGVVISTPPLIAIQDETGAMIVAHADAKTSLKLGDVVEAHGTVISDHFRSRMEDSRIRVLWSDAPVPPLFVTASQLTGGTYRGRSIEVEGTLVSASSKAGGYELVLQDGNQYFRAIGPMDFRLDPVTLKTGSRVRLKGIATSLSEFTNDLYPFAVVTEQVDLVGRPPWWSPAHVVWLILICIALIICTQFILHHLQRWHLRSVLREREELAFQMHDTLAQSFTGISYQLQAASLERGGLEKVHTHIHNALQLVQLSHKEASRTIAALRPKHQDVTGILSALKASADRLSDGGVRITATLSGRSIQLPLELTDAMFRIGQEAISNAIQHSGCSELVIALRISKHEVELCIADNGRGFSVQDSGVGLGIKGMRSRAARTKSRFDLTTKPGAGTKIAVTASLPLGHGLLYRLRAILRRIFFRAQFSG